MASLPKCKQDLFEEKRREKTQGGLMHKGECLLYEHKGRTQAGNHKSVTGPTSHMSRSEIHNRHSQGQPQGYISVQSAGCTQRFFIAVQW